MPCVPGAWPESLVRLFRILLFEHSGVMALHAPPLGGSLEEPRRHPLPPFSGGSVTHLAKKPPLRIVVPPTEYCPFRTDLTLPSTPPSLPTPLSSSCFTFNDRQELGNQTTSVPPTPAPLPSSCPPITTVVDFASPTSSQFLLMPPTPHLESLDGETAIRLSPSTTNEPKRSESYGTKSENLRPWEVSSSTWVSDLGGHTETDRIFRRNLTSADTESSPASTPALSPSAISPSSQVFSALAYNLPTSVARSPVSSPAVLSPYPPIMSPQPSSPARLILKPTGTDTFPSTLDSLQAWRENVSPGLPRSEEPCSPLPEDDAASQPEEHVPDTPTSPSLPSHQLHTHHFPPRASRVSRSQTILKHAKMLGGRVKRLVTRRGVNRHRSSMDRGINFRVVTSQDSENGSVILITAPPPPYESHPPTLVSQSPTGQEHVRSRTISEYSSVVQTSTVELGTNGMTGSGHRQDGSNRNTFRRLSLVALSTIKRL